VTSVSTGYHDPQTGSPFGIRLYDKDDKVLIDHPIQVQWGNRGNDPSRAYVREKIPWNNNARRLVFYEGDRILFEKNRDSEKPKVKLQFNSRAFSETKKGRSSKINWTVTAKKSQKCYYYVLFSSDGGKTYVPVSTRLTKPEISLKPSFLSGGRNCRLKIRVTDGFNTVEVATKSFSLPVREPVAEIHWPPDNADIKPGTVMEVSGQGHFFGETRKGKQKMEWYLNNKLVSTENRFLLTVPPKGKCLRLKLVVTDSRGISSTTIHKLNLK
jgi:hypothetical protein